MTRIGQIESEIIVTLKAIGFGVSREPVEVSVSAPPDIPLDRLKDLLKAALEVASRYAKSGAT